MCVRIMLLLCVCPSVSPTFPQHIIGSIFDVVAHVPPHSSRSTPCSWWSFPSPPGCCCTNEAAPPAYVLHCEYQQQLNTIKLILTGNAIKDERSFFYLLDALS